MSAITVLTVISAFITALKPSATGQFLDYIGPYQDLPALIPSLPEIPSFPDLIPSFSTSYSTYDHSGDIATCAFPFSFESFQFSKDNWELRDSASNVTKNDPLSSSIEINMIRNVVGQDVDLSQYLTDLELVPDGYQQVTGSAWSKLDLRTILTKSWQAEVRFNFSSGSGSVNGDGFGFFVIDNSSIASKCEKDFNKKRRGVLPNMKGLGIILSTNQNKVCALFSPDSIPSDIPQNISCAAECALDASAYNMVKIEVDENNLTVTLINRLTRESTSCFANEELSGLESFLLQQSGTSLRLGLGAVNEGNSEAGAVRIHSLRVCTWSPIPSTATSATTSIAETTTTSPGRSSPAETTSSEETTTEDKYYNEGEGGDDSADGETTPLFELSPNGTNGTNQTIWINGTLLRITAKPKTTTLRTTTEEMHFQRATASPDVELPTQGDHSYLIKTKIKVSKVRLPARRVRRAAGDIYLSPSDWHPKMNDPTSEMYQAVQDVFIEQIVILYQNAGYPITREDVNVTSIQPIVGTITVIYETLVQSGTPQTPETLRRAVVETLDLMQNNGEFEDVFGPDGIDTMDIQGIQATSDDSNNDGLSYAARGGIVGAVLGVVALITGAIAIFFIYRHVKKRKSEKMLEPATNNMRKSLK